MFWYSEPEKNTLHACVLIAWVALVERWSQAILGTASVTFVQNLRQRRGGTVYFGALDLQCPPNRDWKVANVRVTALVPIATLPLELPTKVNHGVHCPSRSPWANHFEATALTIGLQRLSARLKLVNVVIPKDWQQWKNESWVTWRLSACVIVCSQNLDIAKTPKHAAIQFATNLRTHWEETTNMNPIDPPESGNDKSLELWTRCKEMRLESRLQMKKTCSSSNLIQSQFQT